MNKLTCLMGVALLVVCAPLAHATIAIDYSIDGGPVIPCASSGTDTGPITCSVAGKVAVVLEDAISNSPGTSSLAEELSGNLSITNSDTIAHTLDLFVFAQDFTAPQTPPNIDLHSHVGGSVAVDSSANLMSFESCVDPTNSAAVCPGGSTVAGPGIPSITGGSFHNDQFATITSLTSPFTVSEETLLTLGAGTSLNYAASTTLTPVPEPASIILLGITLIGLTGLCRRRLQAKRS